MNEPILMENYFKWTARQGYENQNQLWGHEVKGQSYSRPK